MSLLNLTSNAKKKERPELTQLLGEGSKFETRAEHKTNREEDLYHPLTQLDRVRVKKSALGFREPNPRFLMVPKIFTHEM